MYNMDQFFDISLLAGTLPARFGGRTAASADQIFSIVWVIAGKCACTVDRLEYGLREHQLICLGPGMPYQLVTGDRDQGFMIQFSGAFLEGTAHMVDLQYQDELCRLFSTPVA